MQTTPIEEWLDYLKNGRIKENTTTPGLAEAREKLQYIQMSRADQLAYERHLLVQEDQNCAFGAARLEGRQEGLLEGRQEGAQDKALEIARKMKTAGMAISDIATMTGIPIQDISDDQ